MGRITVEVCVDSAAGLAAAIEGGAQRVELCSALDLGGLTPGPGLLALAAQSPIPVMVMIRPRAGDFVFSDPEITAMEAEIDAVRSAGLAGVVVGASRPGGVLDEPALARLVAAARGLDITLHRAVDLCPDPVAAVATAARLGIPRILSSGGAPRAVDGLETLAAMTRTAAGTVAIMPGSGVTAENAPAILSRLGVTDIHASCSHPVPQDPRAQALGFTPETRRETSASLVSALVSAVSSS